MQTCFYGKQVLVLFLITIAGCGTGNRSVDPEGSWRNVSFRIDINARAAEGETPTVFEVMPDEWLAKLKLKAIVNTFNADGTYQSDHYNESDSLLFTAAGNWISFADSLTFEQQTPVPALYTMHCFKKADSLFFKGFIDWDDDGEADDLYTGRQVQLPDLSSGNGLLNRTGTGVHIDDL